MKNFTSKKRFLFTTRKKKSKETNKELFIKGKNENNKPITFSLIPTYISKQIDILQSHFNKLSVCLPFCVYFFFIYQIRSYRDRK